MAKKSTLTDKRVKLLVCIIGKRDEALLTEACNEVCVSLHFSGIGFGTAKSNYRSYLGLDEVQKKVVFALIPNYAEAKLLKAINKKLRLYLMGKGIAFTIPLSGVSSIISNAILTTPFKEDSEQVKTNRKDKETIMTHELIIAVVNQKYTDKALDASRAAGATGATVLHTRSINNAQAEQLIGTQLTQETDTIAFLTTHEYKAQIMEAIKATAGLQTEGSAVLFSLPVDSLIGIGRFDEENE